MKIIGKILIIDDEKIFRESLAELLQDKFDVNVVDNIDFRDKVKKNNYDLIILDILMDGKDGTQVYDEIKEIDRICKVIALTNLKEGNTKRRYFVNKNVPVFYKPDDNYLRKILDYIYSLKKLRNVTALIVDDEIEKQKNYCEILELIGVKNIECCSTLEMAKQNIKGKKKKYDIYLIDICFKKNGILEAVGDELVDFLRKNNFTQNSVLIPLTSKRIGKAKLTKFKSEKNVFPIFYDVVENFKNKLESIILKSPYWV